MKLKMFESDLFLRSQITVQGRTREKRNGHQTSDIFFVREFDKIKEKTEEYNNSPQKKIHSVNNMSNSNWSPKNSHATLFNHTSVPFNLVCVQAKSISKTKDQIIKESLMNQQPQNKQKGLCEYLDLTRVYSPNENSEYKRAYTSNKAFEKNSNLCSNFLNLHRFYKSICDKPFLKKII